MTEQEFLAKAENYGIDLDLLNVVCGRPSTYPDAIGVFEENGIWHEYENDDRYHSVVYFSGSENDAYDELYKNLFVQINTRRYMHYPITEEIIETDKTTVCEYLKNHFDMDDVIAEETWDYLKDYFIIMNELKYYIRFGKFVDAENCYRVKGYSAEDLYRSTYLSVIGSFNYLTYLLDDPEQALMDLKNGLPEVVLSANGKELFADIFPQKSDFWLRKQKPPLFFDVVGYNPK